MYCSRCGVESSDDTNFCPSCGLDLAATTPIAAIKDRDDVEQKTELDMVKSALKDDYEIDRELGRGGMAIVFMARERALDREVALKVLPFSLSHDEEFVERFQREARTAAKLEHPNIIPIYRVGKTGSVIYFAMKFLRGKSLADVLDERGALPPAEIAQLLKQCASALGYASHHGIVHRDIKPDNIMYSDRGQAIITDFGIAKAATGTKLTGTGMAIGTPYYMSPEQARAQKVDGRSDLYSLGVVAYQCLTGSVPFDGEDSFSIGYKHIMEELPTPTLETDEQRRLFAIIQRMMAKEPDHRFQSGEELIPALEGQAVPAPSARPAAPRISEAATTVAPAAAAPTTPTTPMPSSLVEGHGAPKNKKRSAVLVGALVLVLGGGGIVYTAVMGNELPLVGNLFRGGQTVVAGRDSAAVAAPTDSVTPVARDSAAVTDSLRQLAATPPIGTERGDSAAASPPPDSAAAVAPPPEPPPPAEGTLRLTLSPNTAQVQIDRQGVQGLTHALAPGNHRITASASGYEPFDATVRIAAGQTRILAIRMTEVAPPPPVSQCDDFNPDTYNLNGECFDAQPRPQQATFVPLTPQIQGRPTPVILAIKVNQDGSVAQVLQIRGSDNQQFTILAIQFARGIPYNPAQKNGRPIAGWTQQLFHPGARQ